MRRSLKHLASSALIAILAVGFSPVQSAQAADWVSALSWSNLHVKNESGVFERFRREFDEKSVLLSGTDTQHNQAWVRLGSKSVTATYEGGPANAGKQVQFVIDSDIELTDSLAGDENIAVADATGHAEIVLTPKAAAREDDVIRVDLAAGSQTVGTMVILFKKAGFSPIVKLVGTTTGPQATCDAVYDCQGSDLWEATYEWSVFKREWLPEYAQVFAKSYLFGATIGLNYKVTDIWGTPLKKKDVSLILDRGCSVCKWGKFVSKKATNAAGLVSFSFKNLNTKAQVLKYTSVNPDTKEPGSAFLPFSINPTTNDLDESVDYFWPQIVPDLSLRSTAIKFDVLNRGDVAADLAGDVLVEGIKNPPLALDKAGLLKTDQVFVRIAVTYLRNAQANQLYAPDISVSATNGGFATLATPLLPSEKITAIGKGKTAMTFGYNSSNQKKYVDVILTGTKAGTTTWTFKLGGVTKKVVQTFKN